MNIALKWRRGERVLKAWGRVIPCSCDVRSLENGLRLKNEVVYSIPHGKPYSPQVFPPGIWQIGYPRPRDDCYRRPFFIPTNASRMVRVWETVNGAYAHKTGEFTIDEDYGLHASGSPTTLGCIRIDSEADVVWIAEQIRREYDKDVIYLEVL